MEQPPNPPPRRGTQPLRRPGTAPLDAYLTPGDAGRRTQPLRPESPEALQRHVTQRIEAIRNEMAFVQRLTQLFQEPILVLRYALYLESVADPAPVPLAPFDSLLPVREMLARGIAARLPGERELLKRLQVAVVQYDEAVNGYREMVPLFAELEACVPAEAWMRLPDFAIERLKGKAYPITGFYGNFKNDPLLAQVFPAPRAPAPPSPAPNVLPALPEPARPSGFMGLLKGVWNRT